MDFIKYANACGMIWTCICNGVRVRLQTRTLSNVSMSSICMLVSCIRAFQDPFTSIQESREYRKRFIITMSDKLPKRFLLSFACLPVVLACLPVVSSSIVPSGMTRKMRVMLLKMRSGFCDSNECMCHSCFFFHIYFARWTNTNYPLNGICGGKIFNKRHILFSWT